jgi:predicted enzyme related to lactoylglutathione lyase
MTANSEGESARAETLAHGQLCYLQIPARNVAESSRFYEKAFGWQIERPYPSFEAPGLIGQWVTDRAPAEGGLLAWIHVRRIDETLALVHAHGGKVVGEIVPDGPRLLATIVDPAGNTLGVVQH